MSATRQSEILSELTELLGPRGVLHQEHDLALYEYDATLETARPEYVVLPETTEQTSAVLRFAHERGIPVTPRGGGTSLSGGPLPIEGGIVLCLTRMDKILDIDIPNRRAVVQSGVVNMDLLDALAEEGFLFAPDPASQIACTLGGNVAENAGGPHCLKYGVTVNHITGLEMVLPDGEILRTGGKAADGRGYDLTGIIVGSEGALGVVTEITCRIMPQPQKTITMLAVFDALDDASMAVSGIIAAGLLPATLEMMDRELIRAVQMAFDAGYPEEAEVVLIIEVDGLEAGMERQVERIKTICHEHSVRKFEWADSEAERELLWRGRKGAFGAVANISPNKLCSDVVVPRSELARVLGAVMDIGSRLGLKVGNVFHAGDGNLHPQVLYDARDPDQLARAQQADEEITRLAVSCGGVLTGEHGIGSCKRKWMPVMFSPADLRAQWTLKDVFDPAGLMNPAKILPARDSIASPEPCSLPHGSYEDVCERLVARDESGACAPYDVEAVAKLLALAWREGRQVVIRGGGSKSHDPAPQTPAIRTLGLRKILAANTENMTVRAEAGVRWDDLQAAVGEAGQFVPVRAAHPARATVGGVVATNATDPHHLRYGTCCRIVTGLRFVLSDGETINAGSSCVKNVSGYALDRLLIGSHGTLGFIVDVTFRTLPLPEARATLCFWVDRDLAARAGSAVGEFTAEAVGGHLLPAALEALTPSAAKAALSRAEADIEAPTDGWVVAVGLEGHREEVADMVSAFEALGSERAFTLIGAIESERYDAFWQAVTEVGAPAIQATSPPARAFELGRRVLDCMGSQTALRIGLGTGVIVAAPSPGSDRPPEGLITDVNAVALECGGGAHWSAPCPADCRSPEMTGTAAVVCRRIKRAYDPSGILPQPV